MTAHTHRVYSGRIPLPVMQIARRVAAAGGRDLGIKYLAALGISPAAARWIVDGKGERHATYR